MNARILPRLLLPLLYTLFLVHLSWTAGQLPERVASHFNRAGEPNGWMSRANHLRFMVAFGTGLPLFLVAVGLLLPLLPARLINIPNREHWLGPERRRETGRALCTACLWLACLGAGFVTGLNALLSDANVRQPPFLPTAQLLLVVGLFLLGLAGWMVALLRRFRLPKAEGPPGADSSNV